MKIEEQLDLLKGFVRNVINNDYVYLDIPGYFNVGDHLIYNGAMRILKEALPYGCLYQTVVENFDKSRISEGVNIILQGGGNWGSGYYTPFRSSIIEMFPENRIVIMPHTIRYADMSEMKKDAKLYAMHGDLHLCARDIPSYRLLQDFFSSNHIYLLPDTATGLYGLLPKYKEGESNKMLYMKRLDDEASLEEWKIEDADVKDWDVILDDLRFSRLLWPYKGIRKLGRMTGSQYLKNLANEYFVKVFDPWLMKHIPGYFLRYGILYTTRLHGFILAKLLEMPVEWQDTKYGKISGYCSTWFENE